MRLPSLRMPLPRLSLDWLGALGGRMTVLYIAYTLVLFLVFLIITFPHKALIARALNLVNRGSMVVQINDGDFAWLNGYELTGVRIPSPDGDGHLPLVELNHLWVRPLLTDLMRGNPYAVQIHADMYGGVALGEVRLADGNVVGNVQWQNVDLDRYRTLTSLLDEGRFKGRVSGAFDFEVHGGNVSTGQGSGEVRIEGAGVSEGKVAGFTIPDLNLKQTKLKFAVRGGRLEVQELNASGDLSIQGSGQVVLRDPVQDSVLNLRATIVPTPTTPDGVKALLALIPHAPGAKPDAPMTISGTLARPRVR